MPGKNNINNINGTGHDWKPPNPGGGLTGGGGGNKNNTGSLGGSPSLITSTGGLSGATGVLMIPFISSKQKRYYILTYDTNDFNSEQDSFYYFRQEDVQDDRYITINRVSLTYRELGAVTFTIGVQGYRDTDDTFVYQEQTITLKKPKNRALVNYPDGKLHTIFCKIPAITCIRPQLYYKRKANAGPLSITKARMTGTADQKSEA